MDGIMTQRCTGMAEKAIQKNDFEGVSLLFFIIND